MSVSRCSDESAEPWYCKKRVRTPVALFRPPLDLYQNESNKPFFILPAMGVV